MNGQTVTLHCVQVWWREVPEPESGDGSSSLFNKVAGFNRIGDILELYKANGDLTIINLQATQCVNILEKNQ